MVCTVNGEYHKSVTVKESVLYPTRIIQTSTYTELWLWSGTEVPVPVLKNKKLSYRRGTARCVVSIEILPIATQQCRNYLYDKS